MDSYFRSYLETLKQELDNLNIVDVQVIIQEFLKVLSLDKQIFVIGNGGSASTASHFACDLAKGTVNNKFDNFKRFRVICLNDNIPMLTAIANDNSYQNIFVEQLINLLNPGDVVVAISASGNSPNILAAIEYARKVGAITIGLFGFGGGQASKMVDYQLTIQSKNYGISEDFHIIIEHIMTQMITKLLTKEIQPVVFLDRDGVINYKAAEHDYIKHWDEFQFYPDVFEALRTLKKMEYRLVIASNQRGIARGIFSIESLEEIHKNMLDKFRDEDIDIDKIFYCPHEYSDNCRCRKPALGMFYRAQNELPFLIDLPQSFVVGDSESDIRAGKNLGAETVFIKSGSNDVLDIKPNFIVNNLLDFTTLLKEESEIIAK